MGQAAQDRPAPATPDSDRGVLAVLRRDGLIFPFAAFDRDNWKIAWPIDVKTREIPFDLPSIPDRWWGTRGPRQWRTHLLTGEDQPLELQAPLMFPMFCVRRLGLRTNYRSVQPLPPVPIEPFPKDGLAISGGLAVEPIESVPSTSPEGAALLKTLLKDFDRVEEETLKRVRSNTGWRHNLPPEQRRKLPVRLESWYRSPSAEAEWTVSYVELVRQYPPEPEDKGCGLETLVSGWLHHRKGELKESSDLRAKITYCDRVGATYMLPFGRVRPKERWYWVFQLSGWEDEWYEVAEVGPEKVRYVIEVYAGGQRGCR
jgi:hypothetical protein